MFRQHDLISFTVRISYFHYVAVIKNLPPLIRGTQRLFSVKYLFGEANTAWKFLLLEYG